jgi:hypothetical protein
VACIRVDVIAIRCRRAGYSTGSARSTPRAWTKCLAGGFSDVLNLSLFSARSHTALLVMLVIRARPDTGKGSEEAGTE